MLDARPVETRLKDCSAAYHSLEHQVSLAELGTKDPSDVEHSMDQLVGQVRALQSDVSDRTSVVVSKRTEQLLADCLTLQASLRRTTAKRQSAARENRSVQRLLNTGDEEKNLLHLSEEQKSLFFAQRRVKSMAEESVAILKALEGQRSTMQKTHRTMGDLLETLGLSQHTIQRIRNVTRQDSLIVYIGIVVVVALFWYLFLW